MVFKPRPDKNRVHAVQLLTRNPVPTLTRLSSPHCRNEWHFPSVPPRRRSCPRCFPRGPLCAVSKISHDVPWFGPPSRARCLTAYGLYMYPAYLPSLLVDNRAREAGTALGLSTTLRSATCPSFATTGCPRTEPRRLCSDTATRMGLPSGRVRSEISNCLLGGPKRVHCSGICVWK